MVKENPSPELKNAVINVLKAVNSENTKQEVLKALSGTMKYLSETLSPNKELSDRLANLSARFRSESADAEFPVLKHETALAMQDIEKSIMFSKSFLVLRLWLHIIFQDIIQIHLFSKTRQANFLCLYRRILKEPDFFRSFITVFQDME